MQAEMTATEYDAQRAEEFAGRMVDMLNDASLAVMTSVGHKTGLFDAMAAMPPSTSAEIAAAAGLHERYVREWLGAMVTGRMVEFDPRDATYALPAEHASFLTRRSTPNNIAVSMQFVGMFGQVEDRVVESFRHGGGVGYEHFHGFHHVMAEESAQTVGARLLESILPLVPGAIERLRRGVVVADIGCGAGRVLCAMAKAFPESTFAGYDLSEEAIHLARAEASRQGLNNVWFEVRDVAAMGVSEKFDLVCAFDAIHDQAKPDQVLREIWTMLKPGGWFLMQDIAASSRLEGNLARPVAPYLYTISTMHCMTVSLAQGGAGLGTVWGRELALDMLGQAGFDQVAVHELEHDPFNFYYVMQK